MDLKTKTIRELFEQQVRDLKQHELFCKEDSFDLQFSGRWLQ